MDIERMILLARAIGDTIMRYSGTHVLLDVREFGGDTQRLVDRYAEDTLKEFIDFIDRDPDLLTEGSGYITRGGKGILVVDPVDGSLNADRGVPIYSVSIAYFDSNDLEDLKRAVIYEPVHDIIFYAERGRGSYMRLRTGEEIRLRPPKKPSLEIVYFSLAENTTHLARKLMDFGIRIRELGSVALGMAYTAAGWLDAFIDLRGIVRLMDVAAGLLILKEAGYKVEKKIVDVFPYPRFSLIATTRSMMSALKVYLSTESEGFHSMFPRAELRRDDRNRRL